MRLVAFLLSGPTAHHHGMWRHPETDNAFLTPEYYEHIARVLEAGLFDALFFADILALMDFYKASYETVLSRGGQMGLLDPMPMLAQMARVTKHIGLGGSVSSSFVHAFQTARTFATMDHLSGGRMAWNVVTTSSSPQWANFGLEPLPRDERYDVDKVRSVKGFYGVTYYIGFREDFEVRIDEIIEKICLLETRADDDSSETINEIKKAALQTTHIVPHYHVLSKVGIREGGLIRAPFNWIRKFLIESVYRRLIISFPETAKWNGPADEIIRVGITAKI